MDDKLNQQLNTGIDAILAKKAERTAARQERKQQREETGDINKLVIERMPAGLYYVRWSKQGLLPEELKGKFTHKQRILEIAARRNYEVADNG